VRMRLLGEVGIDASDASGTLLFDVRERRWSPEVLEALELPETWLPPVSESTQIGAAGDQAAGALGAGVIGPELLSVVLGTSGVVFGALPGYRPEPQARLHVFCHALPGTWHAMGVMLSAAESLRGLAGIAGASYGELLEEAAACDPGCDGLLFAPYLSGERTPHADPDARAAFVGLSGRHRRGTLVRAVLEGVAYGLRDSLELLRELGVEASAGRISGGGGRSELWRRIVASILGVPLERSAGADEGAAFGAAMLGGVAAGIFADAEEAVAACVQVQERLDPVADWGPAYEEGYDRFKELYPALRPFERTGSEDGKKQ
jgi:xylulokinase